MGASQFQTTTNPNPQSMLRVQVFRRILSAQDVGRVRVAATCSTPGSERWSIRDTHLRCRDSLHRLGGSILDIRTHC